MIPLAQFLSDQGDDEFVPLRPQPVRRPAAAAQVRSFEIGLPRVAPERPAAAPVLRPTPAPATAPRAIAAPVRALAGTPLTVPTRPAASAMQVHAAPPPPLRPVTEARVPLRELEAERQARAADREAFQNQLDTAVDDARQQGQAEADAIRQDLERVTEARLAELREQLLVAHGTALAEARKAWVEDEGERLADLVILQMAVFEDALKTTLNALLRPLVLDARKRMTVDELAGAVRTIAFDGTTVKIAASGPSDLLNALETKLGDHARHVSFDANETHTDVRIDANQTVIETRLAAWLKAVEEALS